MCKTHVDSKVHYATLFIIKAVPIELLRKCTAKFEESHKKNEVFMILHWLHVEMIIFVICLLQLLNEYCLWLNACMYTTCMQ